RNEPDIAAEIHVEYNSTLDILLNKDKGRQTQSAGKRTLVVVKFRGQENGLPLCVLEPPTRQSKECGAGASTRDVVSIAGVPRFGGCQGVAPPRVGEDLGGIPKLFDFFHDSPFEPIDILGKPWISGQTNVDAALDGHRFPPIEPTGVI